MKGFFDRVFLPGFAFQKRENSVWWDKLLINKSARIISTLDQPAWYYWLIYRQPSNNAVKKLTLQFCGINPVRISTIGPIRLSKETYNLSSILNLDSEFRFKSNSQGEFARNSRLFRVNSTKDITFKMNSFSIFHQ